MTPIRRLIILFWVFIGAMLIWQFYKYNQGIDQDTIAHPQQEHYFFNSTNATPGPSTAAPARDGANVQQIGYTVAANSPGPGSFTARVTVRNIGNAKATAIQVMVRPYRGITLGDQDNGHAVIESISDNDPLAQFGQWISFSDLDPGATETETVVFITRTGVPFGTNPTPQITFQTEKAK